MHSPQCIVDSADQQGEARFTYAQGTLDERLERLVDELSNLFPGVDGLTAEIVSSSISADEDEVRAESITLAWYHYDSYVTEEEFERREPFLYRVACQLMEELAIESFNGESYPDGVWWPERIGP